MKKQGVHQRLSAPMSVRPANPRRAPCRPYGLDRRRIRSPDGTSRDREGADMAAHLTAAACKLALAKIGFFFRRRIC